MGCIHSKTDINDRHPNIFQVANVNDQGVTITPGKLQVTEHELVLYQKGTEPTKWPLRSLRKYGFDSDVFSFECGRRCQTGQGIYAFRSRKAEELFNLVQQYITGNLNNTHTEENHHGNDVSIPVNVQRRIGPQNEGYLNPVGVTRSLSRPGSITSNGPVSPPFVTTTAPEPVSLEHNNNKRGSLIGDNVTYTNTIPESINEPPSYANLDVSGSNNDGYINVSEMKDISHVYMNITAQETIVEQPETVDNNDLHCYANIDSKDIEILRPMVSVPATPTIPYVNYDQMEYPTESMNYADLDLSNKKKEKEQPQSTCDSPGKEKKSYATIDFQKTTALSQSINPRMEVEEGSRKTRHNSTISDVPTRNSNSLSD